jgi:hypothetical protein
MHWSNMNRPIRPPGSNFILTQRCFKILCIGETFSRTNLTEKWKWIAMSMNIESHNHILQWGGWPQTEHWKYFQLPGFLSLLCLDRSAMKKPGRRMGKVGRPIAITIAFESPTRLETVSIRHPDCRGYMRPANVSLSRTDCLLAAIHS